MNHHAYYLPKAYADRYNIQNATTRVTCQRWCFLYAAARAAHFLEPLHASPARDDAEAGLLFLLLLLHRQGELHTRAKQMKQAGLRQLCEVQRQRQLTQQDAANTDQQELLTLSLETYKATQSDVRDSEGESLRMSCHTCKYLQSTCDTLHMHMFTIASFA